MITGLPLVLTGGTVTVLSRRPLVRRALRQLAIGAGVAALTCLVGLGYGVAAAAGLLTFPVAGAGQISCARRAEARCEGCATVGSDAAAA